MFVLQDLQTIPQNGQSREATLRKTPDKWCNERHNSVEEKAFPQYQKYAFLTSSYNTTPAFRILQLWRGCFRSGLMFYDQRDQV